MNFFILFDNLIKNKKKIKKGIYRNWHNYIYIYNSFFGVPDHILPKIVSSSEIYGKAKWGPLEGIPIAGCLGDQQAAFVGQQCFEEGEAKNTYGTGAFMVLNVGHKPVLSKNGLLSTVGYKFGSQPTVYALEGSISVAGSAVNWLRDNLGIISQPDEINELASKGKYLYKNKIKKIHI